MILDLLYTFSSNEKRIQLLRSIFLKTGMKVQPGSINNLMATGTSKYPYRFRASTPKYQPDSKIKLATPNGLFLGHFVFGENSAWHRGISNKKDFPVVFGVLHKINNRNNTPCLKNVK